ncbi:hypothetical protein CPB84DRAFT_1850985 [Gymnopilus junonius]|uniref:Uncharacterized protein n=1 Tax=Gymnopilus junonius TaxID=109634 RepID=A0A9P5NER8_GYMJU|nr:hypothetical protein CPB84DRAFT_1850985 [Gymnopilus junonius]
MQFKYLTSIVLLFAAQGLASPAPAPQDSTPAIGCNPHAIMTARRLITAAVPTPSPWVDTAALQDCSASSKQSSRPY